MDVAIEPSHEFLIGPGHFWLDPGENPTKAKFGWPTLLVNSYNVCTGNKIIASQPKIISALEDMRKEGFEGAERTILHLSGSQSAPCFDSDFRHLQPICIAHGARDRPIIGPIPVGDE
jgi:hypothetical protein